MPSARYVWLRACSCIGFFLALSFFGLRTTAAATDSLSVGARDTTIIAKPGPGIAVGYAYRSGGGEGITGRVFYEAPFGAVLMSCGVIGSMVADDFFGFDLAARKPIWYFDDSGNLLSVSVGFNACVWSNTVTLGVPLGMIFHFPVSFCALEPAIVVTPNFPLTKIDKNTVITSVQIGLRF